jgi:flagellar assembly factor FliW
MQKFKTFRFGELEYQEQDVITLSDGLVGMPNLKNWIILDMGDDVPLKWFQSLDRGDFGFPVTQPYLFHDDYDIKLNKPDLIRMGSTDSSEVVTLIITTIHPGGAKVTGNMLAPLVVDTETRRGMQLTIEDTRFGLRQEINYFKFGLAVKSDSVDDATSGSETENLVPEVVEA